MLATHVCLTFICCLSYFPLFGISQTFLRSLLIFPLPSHPPSLPSFLSSVLTEVLSNHLAWTHTVSDLDATGSRQSRRSKSVRPCAWCVCVCVCVCVCMCVHVVCVYCNNHFCIWFTKCMYNFLYIYYIYICICSIQVVTLPLLA